MEDDQAVVGGVGLIQDKDQSRLLGFKGRNTEEIFVEISARWAGWLSKKQSA